MLFTKMQGVGNDFVVVDETDILPQFGHARLAELVCDRHLGAGADGLLAIDRTDGMVTMRMFNPDGTEDMCGNGLRCAAIWSFVRGWTDGSRRFTIVTRDGHKSCHVISDGSDGRDAQIEVEMSKPIFEPGLIPVILPAGTDPLYVSLEVLGGNFELSCVNTGSTHAVIHGPQPDEATFQEISPILENHPAFPERTSIMWTTRTAADELQIRIWERGAGETLGCGTGACAAVVALTATGHITPGAPIEVKSRGGVLGIRWDRQNPVHMMGPAKFVYRGELPK